MVPIDLLLKPFPDPMLMVLRRLCSVLKGKIRQKNSHFTVTRDGHILASFGESQPTKDQGSPKDNLNQRVGGSILEVIDDMIKDGHFGEPGFRDEVSNGGCGAVVVFLEDCAYCLVLVLNGVVDSWLLFHSGMASVLAQCLSINLKKSNLLGVGVRSEYVKDAAVNLGCLTMKTLFKYLGCDGWWVFATSQAWEDTIGKLKAQLSNWQTQNPSVWEGMA
ncbi:hypothetical protein Tco_1055891 [Tanacetum coccineum]|uniref:Uncharacterized protein n=1 Tax=Tanacetum coccineum TaxID=301880 RepID=A0ABQ5H169_9ASTR